MRTDDAMPTDVTAGTPRDLESGPIDPRESMADVIPTAGTTTDAVPPGETPTVPDDPTPSAHTASHWSRTAWLFVFTIAASLVTYLAVSVPGSWFPSARELVFGPADLAV